MSSPWTLRLCCLAAMAPALTEAATQARVKLHKESSSHCVQSDFHASIAPVSFGQTTDQDSPTLASSVAKTLPKINITANNNTVKSLLQDSHSEVHRARSLVGGTPSLDQSKGMSYQPKEAHSASDGGRGPGSNTNQRMPKGGGLSNATSLNKQSNMGYLQKKNPKVPTILLPAVSLKTQPSGNPSQKQLTATQGNDSSNMAQFGLNDSKITKGLDLLSDRELFAETKKHQRDLERRTDRLLRRLRHLQGKQMTSHVQHQLRGLVDHQHKNLQSMAKSMKSQPESLDLKADLLQSEDVKSLSTAALVTLVRRLQSQQALSLKQRLSGSPLLSEPEPSILKLDTDLCVEMNRVSGTLQMNLHHLEDAIDSDATESSSGGESCDEDYDIDEEKLPKPSLHRRAEWRWAMDRAAVAARWTWLQAQVSDLEYRIRQQSDIFKQIRHGKGAVLLGDAPAPGLDLLGVKSSAPRHGRKLTPLEEKIANLERKNTEMSPCNLTTLLNNVDKQSTRLTQQLGNVYSPMGSPMLNNKGANSIGPTKSQSTPNGFVDPSSSQQKPSNSTSESNGGAEEVANSKGGRTEYDMHFDPPSPAVDTTCTAARCRPVRSYGKRKLLRTERIYQLGRKAARLSTIRCHCYPPKVPCAMCGGRYNNKLVLDPITMPFTERLALLDPAFHPVLSFNHDVPLPIHFEALLKSGDWQHKPTTKPIRPMTATERRRSRITDRPVRKYTRRLPKTATAAMVSSARIKNKYEHKQLTRNHQSTGSGSGVPEKVPVPSREELRMRMQKRKAAIHAMDSLKKQRLTNGGNAGDCMTHSASSSSLKDHLRRRRGESAFDINNIVIPYSMAASTRVEKLQYKEIITPSWREVSSMNSKGEPVTEDETKEEHSKGEPVTEDEKKEEKPTESNNTEPVVSVKNEIKEEPAVEKTPEEPEKALDEPIQQDEFEDISEESIRARHLRCEITEKKKFTSYIQQQRRGRGIRSDSVTSSLAENLDGDSSQTPPATPAVLQSQFSQSSAGLEDSFDSRRRSGSVSSWTDEPSGRRRNSSASKLRSRSSSIEEKIRLELPQEPQIPPWEIRTFPLNDAEYENLFKEPSSVTTQIIEDSQPSKEETTEKLATFVTEYPEDSVPPSPFSDTSTISNIMEGDLDDPNDPEWTVVGPEKVNPKPTTSHSLVLKLAKR